VPVGPEDGVPAESVVNLDDIGTIPKALLESPIAQLSPARMSAIRRAIMFALDL
jgi:mRNA-degrading endonuclease toxin of MazEF toxin-antitoxin module